MNVELLLKVKAEILSHPKAFDMSVYAGENQCGTTGCIAGRALLLSGYQGQYCGQEFWNQLIKADTGAELIDPKSEAQRLLALNEEQGSHLFFNDHWPDEFRDQWKGVKEDEEDDDEPGTTQLARIAAAYIDYFIANPFWFEAD